MAAAGGDEMTRKIRTQHRAGLGGPRRTSPADAGFSIVETMVALGILAFGLLGMAGVLSMALTQVGSASTDVIARQKAIEAIESVYAARDSRVRTWAQIRNVQGGSGSDGGVFLDGAQPLRTAGTDGLVNTADDGAVEVAVEPGPDGQLGNSDDISTALSNYTREIRIRDVSFSLRQITVIVTLQTGRGTRSYTISTLISSYA
jgi:Tfp pilus assembly protein PilV